MIDAAGELLVRRLAAAVRGALLYAPSHPIVARGVDHLHGAFDAALRGRDQLVVGFLGDEVVVNDVRLSRSASLICGVSRALRDRNIEKISVSPAVTRTEVRALVEVLSGDLPGEAAQEQLVARGVHRVSLGTIGVEDLEDGQTGILAAERVYGSALETSETFWEQARAETPPNATAAGHIVTSLARLVRNDASSLVALTTLKRHDAYTFTHMVNVSVLSMALARSLGIDGGLLHEIGLAALLHDIGKTRTPLEVLNKPGRLTAGETEVMQRHVIDGAQLLRELPDMPALAPIVAFEHHLRPDGTGYPRGVDRPVLNLCTLLVGVVDVFDALRTNRPYREGLATARVKAIMAEQDRGKYHPSLLRRFVHLVGLYPVGQLVRLASGEIAVVTREHPQDPFRPQVKTVLDPGGQALEEPRLLNTWEPDGRGEFPHAVTEALDPEEVGLDPLALL